MSLLGWKPANAFFIVLRYERTRPPPLRCARMAWLRRPMNYRWTGASGSRRGKREANDFEERLRKEAASAMASLRLGGLITRVEGPSPHG